jgi:succinate dehydrogenase/fumarate reductase cytochrome b subunit
MFNKWAVSSYQLATDKPLSKWVVWMPVLATSAYPFFLNAFHALVTSGGPDSNLAPAELLLAIVTMLAVFAIPAMGLALACLGIDRRNNTAAQLKVRRLALFIICAPTLYCFIGVNLIMAGAPVPDEWFWVALWIGIGAFLSRDGRGVEESIRPIRALAAWRVAHGIAGAIVLLFIAFHLFNHLFGLAGPQAHAQVMEIGRKIYRSSLVEPILVVALLFQVFSGLRLAWNWSAVGSDNYRIFQVGSGVFLAVFILGHLNAVFVFARTYAGIETGWDFASGDPVGMIHDPWGIRLLPHYSIGVFFIITHLFSGLRGVMLAHGASQLKANQIWLGGAVFGALISLLIMLGITGVRLF